jgi:hypothetical protein
LLVGIDIPLLELIEDFRQLFWQNAHACVAHFDAKALIFDDVVTVDVRQPVTEIASLRSLIARFLTEKVTKDCYLLFSV